MKKSAVDKIITEYYKKLYGFSLSKLSSIDKAEELASQITVEVYSSLLKAENIGNINGYIYRIASNVYARYITKAKENSHLNLDSVSLSIDIDLAESIIDCETANTLKREIAYLSKTQRKIVVLHFYENKKLHEISEMLNLPLGTVKWHLYEAKNSLKEGINMKRTATPLGLNPISFSRMGHSGWAGQKGDTGDFFKNSLTQNIAYCAYHTPKTVKEIAEELGVSPVFIEDEVNFLEEYGFLDRLSGNKYQTNIYITETDEETEEKLHSLYQKYGLLICEKYIPMVFETVKNIDKNKFYIPDEDENLLKWAFVTLAVGRQTVNNYKPNILEKYAVKRPDGGCFIPWAEVKQDLNLSYDPELYNTCGDMNCKSMKYNVESWTFNSYYDSRKKSWRDNLYTDFDYLYEHMTGKIKKDDASLEKYQRLYEKGYLTEKSDKSNVIITTFNKKDFLSLLPEMDTNLKEDLELFNEKVYEITKPFCAKHMLAYHKDVCNFSNSDNRMRATVLELLIKNCQLSLPTENQKATLNTIMFCDTIR